MMQFFYRNGDAPLPPAPVLPAGCAFRIWRPAADGFPPAGPCSVENTAWFAFARLGLFAWNGFAELSVWEERRMLHRLVVTPRWFRFPFMASRDLQIGALWTAPHARRRGLARATIAEAHRRHPACNRFWYVTDDSNEASVRLASGCGYAPAGTGKRTRPLGLSALGRFRLDPIAGATLGGAKPQL
jgi:RimJ/RimL family protein N-acetyltransferase